MHGRRRWVLARENGFLSMWTWLQDNHGPVSALASIFTLAIWTLYFQILLSSYHHRLRPKILINRGAGHTLHAHCVIANMSAEPIYIEAILADIGFRGEQDSIVRRRCSLSDLDLDIKSTENSDLRPQWFQGPLDSGEFISVGTYHHLLDRAASSAGVTSPICEVTLTVVATYTAQDALVAACRTFDIERDDGGDVLMPRSLTATQIRSRAEQQALERWMKGRMPAREKGNRRTYMPGRRGT